MNDEKYRGALLKAEQDYTDNGCCKMSECPHFKIGHMKNAEIGYYETRIYHPLKKEWLCFINCPSVAQQQQLNLLHYICHRELEELSNEYKRDCTK